MIKLRYLPYTLTLIACITAYAGFERDASQVRSFRLSNPCPSTFRTSGACPGWQVDHIVPLCAGGADSPDNMQWISVEDHRFKTFVDVRECRKLRRAENPQSDHQR